MIDRIWAPWRAQYIRDASNDASISSSCFLCQGLASDNDRDSLVAWRGDHSIVVLNRFPYNNGHLLVAPRRSSWLVA